MNASVRPFDHVAFDLDDTLLDTTGLIAPHAARETCNAMIAVGLNADIEKCLVVRSQLLLSDQRTDVIHQIIEHFGLRPGAHHKEVAEAGLKAFYQRSVAPDLQLISGVRELLEDMKTKNLTLHLVTSGHKPTQAAKIQVLKLDGYFKSIHIVDMRQGEHKQTAFAEILRGSRRLPARHLSVGNRVDTDIGEAREIGWMGCWVRHGEHAHLGPRLDCEFPDFTISHILELKKICRL